MKTILKHELTHSLEGTQAYADLSNYLLNDVISNEGIDIDRLIQAKITDYGAFGETLTEDGAIRELIADYVGDNLFTSEKAIRQLSAEKPSLARRILNWIRSMKTELFGTNHEKLMAEAEKMYHDALMEPFSKRNGEQYSIIQDAKNRDVVYLERDIFDGYPPQKWPERLEQWMLDNLAGKKINTKDGFTVMISERTGLENAVLGQKYDP